jgi:Ser/Thr protein kinase RdoA (MazF antagonist)
VPVPKILAMVDMPTASAVLLERRPGTPAGRLDDLSLDEVRQRGAHCAVVHARLAALTAPSVVADVDDLGENLRGHNGLLHLDLHPFNVLLDDAGQLTGVIDWANAAAGDPQLDRARTLTILTLDPAALRRRRDPRWAALTDTWIEEGRLRTTDRHARRWACRYMLNDLRQRHPPDALRHIQEALERCQDPRR